MTNFENCNSCKYQVKIYKHPWNTEPWSKGSCTEMLGYGCSIEAIVIFFSKDKAAIGCEMHKHKKDN